MKDELKKQYTDYIKIIDGDVDAAPRVLGRKARAQELIVKLDKLDWSTYGFKEQTELRELLEELKIDSITSTNRITKLLKKEELKEAKANAKIEQAGESEVDQKLSNYYRFKRAKDFIEANELGFFRDSTDFFIKKNYCTIDRKTGKKFYECQLDTYGYNNIIPAFKTEIRDMYTRDLIRELLDGEEIIIENPSGEMESFQLERSRVYNKLVSTPKQEDPETYNMIDLSNTVKPTGNKDAKLYWVTAAHLKALGGQKGENIDSVKRYIYSVSVADIGNNQCAMLVIFGPGKSGKNALAELVIPSILGAELCFAGTWDTIDSNFNAFKLGKVFIFIDELPVLSTWGKIKQWLGGIKDYIKKKYGQESECDNAICYMLGSNSENYPLPVEDGRQMNRVSPIKAVKKHTFAETVYHDSVKIYGKGWIEKKLARRVDLNTVTKTPFEIGDAYLRAYTDQWTSKIVIQNLVDVLHNEYGSDKQFKFSPLRGDDWNEILSTKGDLSVAAVEYMVAHDPDYIVIDDLLEVYLLKHAERVSHGSRASTKGEDSLRSKADELLPGYGYIRRGRSCRVTFDSSVGHKAKTASGSVDLQRVVYAKPEYTEKFETQLDSYIAEIYTPSGPKKMLL